MVGGRENAPDGAGDRAHGSAAGGQLASGRIQALEELLRGLGRAGGHLGQRLDRPAGHPAAAVGAVVPQLGGDGSHPEGFYESSF